MDILFFKTNKKQVNRVNIWIKWIQKWSHIRIRLKLVFNR